MADAGFFKKLFSPHCPPLPNSSDIHGDLDAKRLFFEQSKTYDHMKELRNMFTNENIMGFMSVILELKASDCDKLISDVFERYGCSLKHFDIDDMSFTMVVGFDLITLDVAVSDVIDESLGSGISISVTHKENSVHDSKYSFSYVFAEDLYKDNSIHERNKDILKVSKYENSVLNTVSSYLCGCYCTLCKFVYYRYGTDNDKVLSYIISEYQDVL
jgi:hypothetical protein